MIFSDPAALWFFPDWQLNAEYAVDLLHLALGFDPDNAALISLIEKLREASPEFARLWQSNAARGLVQRQDVVVHPDVGSIEFSSIHFDVRGVPGQQLIICFTEPGSQGAKAIALLSSKSPTRI